MWYGKDQSPAPYAMPHCFHCFIVLIYICYRLPERACSQILARLASFSLDVIVAVTFGDCFGLLICFAATRTDQVEGGFPFKILLLPVARRALGDAVPSPRASTITGSPFSTLLWLCGDGCLPIQAVHRHVTFLKARLGSIANFSFWLRYRRLAFTILSTQDQEGLFSAKPGIMWGRILNLTPFRFYKALRLAFGSPHLFQVGREYFVGDLLKQY